MTSADVTELARATGVAGRSWHEFQCEDTVQSYCDDNPVRSAEIREWEAAFEAGALEHRMAGGWVTRWTTAPADYDSFGTTGEVVGEWHGKPLRSVLIHPHHVGYHECRYGSGLHGLWSEDPREEQARWRREQDERARREAERATLRTTGLEWLVNAADDEIDAAIDDDNLNIRGLEHQDARAELANRANARADAARAAEWDRCAVIVPEGAILVDYGAPSTRGTYGTIPGRDPHVYYSVRITNDWRKIADDASVTAASGESAGSLAMVADWISSGRLRVVDASDVPPAPVTARIGHESYRDIQRIQIGERDVWVGRPRFASDLLVLDENGRMVRSKALKAEALARYRR